LSDNVVAAAYAAPAGTSSLATEAIRGGLSSASSLVGSPIQEVRDPGRQLAHTSGLEVSGKRQDRSSQRSMFGWLTLSSDPRNYPSSTPNAPFGLSCAQSASIELDLAERARDDARRARHLASRMQ